MENAKHQKNLRAGLLVGALALAGCTTDGPGAASEEEPESGGEVAAESADGMTIGITVADLANPYYVTVIEGMDDECAELGCTVEVHDGKQDTMAQISAVENFVTKGVDVIIVAPNADGAVDAAAEQAQEAGIPVIALAQGVEGSDAWIRLSELEDGATVGTIGAEWINENLESQADAKVLIVGDTTVTNTAQRVQGIRDGLLEGAPDAVIVAEAPANSTEEAMAATENALTANPGINLVLGANDDTAMGAYEAMVAAGKTAGEAAVIGFDATPEAIRKIADESVFAGTVSVSAYKQGGLLVETAEKVRKEGALGDIYVPFDPVTLINVQDYVTE